eukprot:gnl/MRDRNA2_/MRDRNA2_120347_c0_seq1.p1 gnl/MRDRNA2_/MRDRNA2_120347_c0~~gnl/MRDRNA2_/MRDRNA2_120347_c0_seq1.p1  ORF type:complete len:509 (+),score=80.67 gnl/MRDRNA2_/MRDRNA2_120347_c0_seq1:90-1616(+)
MKLLMLIISLGCGTVAEKAEDLVTSLPGFPDSSTWGFKAYSGMLDVPGPINGYDSLRIHYQFHTSQRDPSKDPVAIWHQGGPGGSSIDTGLYGEMGAFRIGDHGNYLNPHAWNKVANMLYLESPAGSGTIVPVLAASGFSECIKSGKPVRCSWNDKTQAEAYAHTLQAFFKAFPEYAENDFYLTGESYFGQYGPNIAHFILNNAPFNSSINLKGIAAGNACWGGTETCVACNGPSEDKIDVDLFFGKALFSTKLKRQIDAACNWPTTYKPGKGKGPFGCDNGAALSLQCRMLLAKMRHEVGPHNVYNIYDNCQHTLDFLERVGKDQAWLTSVLRYNMHNSSGINQALIDMNGGFKWDCGGDVSKWIQSAEVRKALHLDRPGRSGFDYETSGPASITLWPELVQKIRVLIYNGDADACVPYNGNEAWIDSLEEKGVLKETAPWTPWFTSSKVSPSGYITKYQAPGAAVDFSFATIRLAGHMVPQFQPEASLVMLQSFLSGSRNPALLIV